DPTDYSCYQRGASSEPPFYAFGAARTVVLVDVPKTAPRDDVDGCQLVAWGAHDPRHAPASRPEELLDEIRRDIGAHPGAAIEFDGAWNHPQFLSDYAAAAADGAQRRVDVLRRMCERRPDWDLVVMAMGEAHTAGHHMWHGVDPSSHYADAVTAPVARRAL